MNALEPYLTSKCREISVFPAGDESTMKVGYKSTLDIDKLRICLFQQEIRCWFLKFEKYAPTWKLKEQRNTLLPES